jgi:hypothetical protein
MKKLGLECGLWMNFCSPQIKRESLKTHNDWPYSHPKPGSCHIGPGSPEWTCGLR